MLADGLNKGAISRKALLKALMKGLWLTEHPTVSVASLSVTYSNDIVEHDLSQGRPEVD